MVSKNSTPPAVRLGRRGSPPMKGASSISSTNEQASALSSREASPSQARSPQRLAVDTALQSRRSMSLEVEGNSPLTQRPRANTDTRVQYPPFGYMTPRNASPTPEYRPAVPEKDNIEHSRSRSLSPPALGKAKEEKPEKRRNVFGLFPSEKKDGSEKKGMANHIAAVFHRERKPSSSGPIQGAGSSSESAAMSSRSAPTPAPATYYTPPMMGLSPRSRGSTISPVPQYSNSVSTPGRSPYTPPRCFPVANAFPGQLR
ncbi:hypothetical protein BDZ91DRAFT_537159 [Kalaharituber pfeilii]|nr:hypothetical protein BDZ91DRAFT_537159 [Kalaharituber pfeilii]